MSDPLTVKEAAGRLRLSAASVYALCKAKQLRHRRAGIARGKILIPPEAIEEYIALTTVDTTEAAPRTPDSGSQHGIKTFANLDQERLLAAWKKQGKA